MELSTNTFTDMSISQSPSNPTDVSFQSSANPTTKVSFTLSDSPIKGDNLGSGAFGADEMFSGTPFGMGVFGGISRFKNR